MVRQGTRCSHCGGFAERVSCGSVEYVYCGADKTVKKTRTYSSQKIEEIDEDVTEETLANFRPDRKFAKKDK